MPDKSPLDVIALAAQQIKDTRTAWGRLCNIAHDFLKVETAVQDIASATISELSRIESKISAYTNDAASEFGNLNARIAKLEGRFDAVAELRDDIRQIQQDVKDLSASRFRT